MLPEADKLLKIAKRFSRIISWFPFVRCICLSGSLSKRFADKKSDIDYFIITEPNRLWLCKMLLILFKKTFLFNSHRYFCVNYFVDRNSLEIEENDLYTAIEIVSLIPLYNENSYREFIAYNKWVEEYYPGFIIPSHTGLLIPSGNVPVKSIMEKLLSGQIGEKLDVLSFSLFSKRLKRKYSHLDDKTFSSYFLSNRNISKHHPNGFREKILKSYQEEIGKYEKYFGVSLH